MDSVNNILKGIDNTMNNIFNPFLNNYYAQLIFIFILVVYSSLINPNSPPLIFSIIDNWISKILVFIIIVYFATKESTIAIILTIALFSTLIASNRYQVNKKMENIINKDVIDNINLDNISIDNLSDLQTIDKLEELIPETSVNQIINESKNEPLDNNNHNNNLNYTSF